MTAPRRGGWLLALVGPAVVVGGWWQVAARPGAVPAQVAAMDRALGEVPPQIVVVGNSMARLGVDARELAAGLDGLPGVVSLTMDGTGPATWLAILQERVWKPGHAPWLVVVPTVPPDATRAAGDDAWDRDGLALQRGGRADGTARWVRAGYETAWRDLAAAMVVALLPGGRASDVEVAVRGVLGDPDAMDAGLHRRAIPVVDPRGGPRGPARHDALVQLVHEVQAHQAAVLVVRLPVTARAPSEPADADAALALAGALDVSPHAGLLDLSALKLPTGAFLDDRHLAPAGQAVVTDALAQFLVDHGVAQGASGTSVTFPHVRPPLVAVEVARQGTPDPLPAPIRVTTGDCCVFFDLPALAPVSHAGLAARGLIPVSPLVAEDGADPLSALGLGADDRCDGTSRHAAAEVVACHEGITVESAHVGWAPTPRVAEEADGRAAWWLLPGTTTTWTLPPQDAAAQVVGSFVEVLAGSSPATMLADATPLTLKRRGQRVHVSGALAAGQGPTLSWRSPAGGALAQLESLGLRWPDGSERWLVGSAATDAPRRLALLDHTAGVALSQPGPAVPVVLDGPPEPQESAGVVLLPTAAVGALSDRARLGRDPGASCNPVRVEGPDGPLPGANLDLSRLRAGAPGYLLVPEGVLVVAGDLDPLSLRVERVADLPAPRCRDVAWLHGGGAGLEAELPGWRLVAGASSLAVQGEAFGADGVVHLQVTVDDVLRLDVSVGTDQLGDGVVLALSPPLAPTDGQIRVVLDLGPAGSSALLRTLDLREAQTSL